MTAAVATAIEDLRAGAPCSGLRFEEDSNGGAYVIVDDVDIGDAFEPQTSWIGFHITWVDPDADIYPHFIDPAVRYVGTGAAPNVYPEGNLPVSITRGAVMPGFELPAIQISRRSNRRGTATDSALCKLLRVIAFLRTR